METENHQFKAHFISTGLISMFFIEPENHQFGTSSSRGVARNFFLEESWMLAAMVDEESFGILD